MDHTLYPDSLWNPGKSEIANSKMLLFIKYLNTELKLNLNTYKELHRWSIENSETFWDQLLNFLHIKLHKEYEHKTEKGNHIYDCDWFPEAELNYAEHCFRFAEDKTALISIKEDGAREYLTYSSLQTMVYQIAESFHQVGIKSGDTVAAIITNRVEAVAIFLACSAIGAIWAPCLPEYKDKSIINRLKQTEPKILITVDGYQSNGEKNDILAKVQSVQEQVKSIENTYVLPNISENPDLTQLENTFLFSMLYQAKPKTNLFTPKPFNHPLSILFSSGIDGEPKCIVHGAGGTLLQHLKEISLHNNISQEDIVLMMAKPGLVSWQWMVSILATGASLVLYDGDPNYPDLKRALHIIEEEKVTVFGALPQYFNNLEKHLYAPNDDKSIHDLSSLKLILSYGSELMHGNYEYIYEDFKKEIRVSSMLLCTDINSCFALGNPILPVHSGEIQCLPLGMDVAVYNEHGKPVINEKGELVCRNSFPGMPIYFWDDFDKTKYHQYYFNKYPDIWNQGDYVIITKHSGLKLFSHSKTVIPTKFGKIGSNEIVSCVQKLDDVFESVACGYKDGDVFEKIVLLITLKGSRELTEDVKAKINSYISISTSEHHKPWAIVAVDQLPKTFDGKIAEFAIKQAINGEEIEAIDLIANPESLEKLISIKLEK